MQGGVIVAAKSANPNVDVFLAAGDVIHSINNAPVETIEGLRSALDRVSPNGSAVLQIAAGKADVHCLQTRRQSLMTHFPFSIGKSPIEAPHYLKHAFARL